MASLRTQLTAFWLLLSGVCIGLGFVMVILYENSAGVQISQTRSLTERTCEAIATRYRQSASSSTAALQAPLIQVILRLALVETPHVEGGIWNSSAGFVAYAYPTYEGGGAKTDVPDAERPHIAEVAGRAIHDQSLRTDILRGTREALILTGCPLPTTSKDAAVWIMTRVPAEAEAASRNLRTGLGVLLAAILLSGVWLGAILTRGYRHVRRVELALDRADERQGEATLLKPTGVVELDRIIAAVNRYSVSLQEAQGESRDLARQHAHNQRLTALGRMVGSIAHEIRNPIATMRLKAENALAGSPDGHSGALKSTLQQIDRLERLVQNLLATVQPLRLHPVPVAMGAWLAERREALDSQASARNIHVVTEPHIDEAIFDPLQMARAIDNLLENAVRHTPISSTVRLVVLHSESGALLFRVIDQGEGVPPDLQDHLFEPFATSRAEGTGLGLALVREIALAHDGEVRYVPLSEGACFELEIPWRES